MELRDGRRGLTGAVVTPERRRRVSGRRVPFSRAAGILAIAAVIAAGIVPLSPAPAGGGADATASSWTVYHGATDGSGVATSFASVDLSRRRWTSPALDGDLYGEPLVADGRVFLGTENDTLYALSAITGRVSWSAHIATPVASSALPCGDIAPTVGITGTPVIDAARHELFAVADEVVAGHPAHRLVGLDTATGKVELSQDVDPPGADPAALLQRTGLTLDAGRIVFGYGGNYGDCATYHGWVVSVPESGGALAEFGVDAGPGETEGAVWMGGAAPVIDGSGNVWVTTGNGSVTAARHAFDDSEAVLELSSSLELLQYFAPTDWASNNARDLDLSTAPALLSNGQVVAAGKTRAAYVLDAQILGGIGGQHATLDNICGSAIDGGVAVQGTTVFLPCLAGPVAVEAAGPGGPRLVWQAPVGGGPPIVAAGLVWTMSQDGYLFGLDPATGRVRKQALVGLQSNHFATPSVGAGLLLAPNSRGVVAFAGTSAQATTTTTARAGITTPTAAPAPTSSAAPAPQRNAWATTGIIIGGLAMVAALLILLRGLRRRP